MIEGDSLGFPSASTSGLRSWPLTPNLLASALSSRQVPACLPQGSGFLQDALTGGGSVLSFSGQRKKNHRSHYHVHTLWTTLFLFYLCMVSIMTLSSSLTSNFHISVLAWWGNCQRISDMLQTKTSKHLEKKYEIFPPPSFPSSLICNILSATPNWDQSAASLTRRYLSLWIFCRFHHKSHLPTGFDMAVLPNRNS